MKYVDEFRSGEVARKLAKAIAAEVQPGHQYRLMEFCGGHTHAIFRYGVQDLLPKAVQFVHGPGCPVCVLPPARIEQAIQLATQHQAILCSYGDVLRVPVGKGRSLLQARAAGADIRMIYSTQDALQVARENPDQQVVLFAIGFETTTPPTAIAILQAEQEGLANFSVHCNHVLTPPAIRCILDTPQAEAVAIDGFLGPSHVSTLIGYAPYEPFASEYAKPVVISGFEPLDVMQSVQMLVRQINDGRHEVENQYRRAVTRDGNLRAQQLVAEVFELRSSFEWRGLGELPNSALRIREKFAALDAEQRFSLQAVEIPEVRGCACPEILRGAAKPTDCKLFGTVCTPENPIGSCMVSSEGACAAYWTYRRFGAQHAQG